MMMEEEEEKLLPPPPVVNEVARYSRPPLCKLYLLQHPNVCTVTLAHVGVLLYSKVLLARPRIGRQSA